MSKASLQSMSADAKENLEDVPDAWGASQISSFFTGRADWGLFASVFPCLWGEVADKLSTEDDRARALELVKSKDFLRDVQNFRRTEGIAPHPAVAYSRDLGEGAVETCPGVTACLDAAVWEEAEDAQRGRGHVSGLIW